jgi:hypothetical protein
MAILFTWRYSSLGGLFSLGLFFSPWLCCLAFGFRRLTYLLMVLLPRGGLILFDLAYTFPYLHFALPTFFLTYFSWWLVSYFIPYSGVGRLVSYFIPYSVVGRLVSYFIPYSGVGRLVSYFIPYSVVGRLVYSKFRLCYYKHFPLLFY